MASGCIVQPAANGARGRLRTVVVHVRCGEGGSVDANSSVVEVDTECWTDKNCDEEGPLFSSGKSGGNAFGSARSEAVHACHTRMNNMVVLALK